MKLFSSERKAYFCEEPWTGGFSVQTNQEVRFCSCYLNMKIGDLKESSIDEIWNSPELRQIRKSFSKGKLPHACKGQLCPTALGHGPPEPVKIAASADRQKKPSSTKGFFRRFSRVLPGFRTRARWSNDVVVRQLRADDLPGWFPPAEMALGLKWLARQERGEMYIAVAEKDGSLVGRRCLEFSYEEDQLIAFLFAGTVSSALRSRGIGSLLTDHLETVAIARGALTARAVVSKRNPRALSWHKRQGYRCVGEGMVRWTEADGREVEVDCWKTERHL